MTVGSNVLTSNWFSVHLNYSSASVWMLTMDYSTKAFVANSQTAPVEITQHIYTTHASALLQYNTCAGKWCSSRGLACVKWVSFRQQAERFEALSMIERWQSSFCCVQRKPKPHEGSQTAFSFTSHQLRLKSNLGPTFLSVSSKENCRLKVRADSLFLGHHKPLNSSVPNSESHTQGLSWEHGPCPGIIKSRRTDRLPCWRDRKKHKNNSGGRRQTERRRLRSRRSCQVSLLWFSPLICNTDLMFFNECQ